MCELIAQSVPAVEADVVLQQRGAVEGQVRVHCWVEVHQL